MCGDEAHLRQQAQIRIRGSAVGAERHPDASRQEPRQGIGLVPEIGMRPRTIDDRQPGGLGGQQRNVFRTQVVAMNHEGSRSGGKRVQNVDDASAVE